MRPFIFCVFVLPLALVAGSCSGVIDDLPTTPDPVFVTETFTGTLTVNGGMTHAFFTGATGTITATLTSLGEAPPEKVGFAMGTLAAGGNCNVVIANDTAVVSTVVVGTVQTLQGALCMRVHDVGALTGPVDYTFTVNHP